MEGYAEIAGCQEILVRKAWADRTGDACEWEYEEKWSGSGKERKPRVSQAEVLVINMVSLRCTMW